MNFLEFKDYIEMNSKAYKVFITKAAKYQIDKNNKRSKYKKWRVEQINSKIYFMWNNVIAKLYNDVFESKGKKVTTYKEWVNYLDKKKTIKKFDKSISKLKFK